MLDKIEALKVGVDEDIEHDLKRKEDPKFSNPDANTLSRRSTATRPLNT
jgi:hypothetical protein